MNDANPSLIMTSIYLRCTPSLCIRNIILSASGSSVYHSAQITGAADCLSCGSVLMLRAETSPEQLVSIFGAPKLS